MSERSVRPAWGGGLDDRAVSMPSALTGCVTTRRFLSESLRKPGFEFAWKHNLDTGASQKQLVSSPVLLDFYIGYRGFRSLAFFANNANTVAGIDTDLARTE